MKKLMMLLVVLILTFASSQYSSATLTPIDNNVVHDDLTGLYWQRDLARHTSLDYSDQLSAISNDNSSLFGGYATWHLAQPDEMAQLWTYSDSDIINNFVYSYYAAGYGWQYYGRYEEVSPPGHFQLGRIAYVGGGTAPMSGWIIDTYASSETGAWVVTSSVPVPEPATLLLLGLGLPLVWRRNRRA